MPRPRKPSAKAKEASASKLLDALKFLGCVTKDEGAPFETHVALANKTATASNGVLSAGVLIDEDLIAAPHNKTLIQALSKCGDNYSLTELDRSRLSIKSGNFKAFIPCIDITILNQVLPDVPHALIDDRFKEALNAIHLIKPENAQRIELLAFVCNGGSIISTDGKILIEYWHGVDMPTGMPIPKSIIPAIIQNPKKLSKFGYSNSSITFFFEDDSWIKTQLYAEQFPLQNCLNILNRNSNAFPIPSDFYTGLEAVISFSEHGSVYFERELLCSHQSEGAGATYEVKGLPKGPIYNAKYLQIVKPYVETIDFVVPVDNGGYLAYFFGKNVRGVIAGHG